MAIRYIVKEGDPILNKVCRPVTNFDDRLATLLDDMRETMIAADGVGLAGPQVGMLRRVAVTRPANNKNHTQDRNGEGFELEAEGLLARCIQHENDHLDGITIMESSEFFYEDTEEGRAAAAKKKEND